MKTNKKELLKKNWQKEYEQFQKSAGSISDAEAIRIVTTGVNLKGVKFYKGIDLAFILNILFLCIFCMSGKVEHSLEAIRSLMISDMICIFWLLLDIFKLAKVIYFENMNDIELSIQKVSSPGFADRGSCLQEFDQLIAAAQNSHNQLLEKCGKKLRRQIIKRATILIASAVIFGSVLAAFLVTWSILYAIKFSLPAMVITGIVLWLLDAFLIISKRNMKNGGI